MQYCPKCKVDIPMTTKRCPLCQGQLKGIGDENQNIFPHIEISVGRKPLLLKCVWAAAIVVAIVSLVVNYITFINAWWSIFVVAGVASAAASITLGILKEANVMKNILWQLTLISALAIIWDFFTGWHLWSLNYVFPSICVAVMVSMAIMAKLLNIPIRDYVIYLILDAIFGIIPVIFLLTGILTVDFPSVICIGCSVASIVLLILFEGDNIRKELRKRVDI